VIPLIVAIALFFVGCGLIFGILVGSAKLLRLGARKYASFSHDVRDRENSQEANTAFYA
jgi:hypothetical protein